ncbi:DUF485 domain-containing protein [Streptomyces sp. NBC_00487]|uniref:DUF485 domain-containing protein n=1 Tax=unclassified Streptomyces TaxID=2593676 RepID=UPI002E16DC69|nr:MULTISPECIES: DUF485 domain-containing protein [unclassified Streptomyces]
MHPYEQTDRHDDTDPYGHSGPRAQTNEQGSWSDRAPQQLRSLPSRNDAAALRKLRAARKPPAKVAAAVAGGQVCAVVLAAEVPGFMGTGLLGPVNIGLVLILVELALAAWAMVWYGRYAGTKLDPVAARLRPVLPPQRKGHR